MAFATTRKLAPGLVEALRDGPRHASLALKSPDTLLRGQFEPIFWAELEALIAELNEGL